MRRVLASRLVREATGLTTGRGLGALLSAVWLAVVARHLPLTGFGQLALLLALHQVFFFLGDPGTSVLVADHVARQQTIDGPLLRAALGRRLRGSALTIGAVTAAYAFTTPGRGLLIPALFAGSVVGNALHTTFAAALRSVGRVGPEAFNEPLSRLTILVGGGLWLAHGGGLAAVVTMYSLADLGSAAALGVVIHRHRRRQAPAPAALSPDFSLRRGLPIAAGAGLTTFYYKADAWLVTALAGAGATARYAASYKFLEACLLPATVLGALVLSHVVGAGGGARTRAVRRFVLAAAAITAVLSVPFLVAAPTLLSRAFGTEYGGAAGTLRLLMLSGLGSAVVATLAPLAAVCGGRRFPLAFSAATAINVACLVAFVPRLGLAGAAWANLLSQGMLAASLLMIVVRPEPSRPAVTARAPRELVGASR